MPLPNQSSKTLDSLETNAVSPRISSRKQTCFSSSFCSLHSWKLSHCLSFFAKETQVDHLEDLGEGAQPTAGGL